MFEKLFDATQHGFAMHDVGLALLHICVGMFFLFSGYHKLFYPERHAGLVKTLTEDKVPLVPVMEWWVPLWEFTAGGMLLLGWFTSFAAFVLLVICAVACLSEARIKVAAYAPVGMADRIDDYLYLPEVLYIVMLLVCILAGGGRYSLDAIFWS